MPRTWTRRATSSSSDERVDVVQRHGAVAHLARQVGDRRLPWSRSRRPSASMPSGSASTAAGERPSANSFRNRPWIVDAAAPASCWYMIDRTSAAKLSSQRVAQLHRAGRLDEAGHRGVAAGHQPGAAAPSSCQAWPHVARSALARAQANSDMNCVEVVAAQPQLVLAEVLQRRGRGCARWWRSPPSSVSR